MGCREIEAIVSCVGIVLVHGYLRIDPDLVLPKVRKRIYVYM